MMRIMIMVIKLNDVLTALIKAGNFGHHVAFNLSFFHFIKSLARLFHRHFFNLHLIQIHGSQRLSFSLVSFLIDLKGLIDSFHPQFKSNG
jgi:hypothetical protein